MGQLLSHPIEEKTLDYHTHDSVSYCIGLMQGYRMTMEDAHNVKVSDDESVMLFGVFDGHGGKYCAENASHKLCTNIFKGLNKARESESVDLKRYMRIIKDSFFRADHDLPRLEATNCGTTAVIASVIANKYAIIANTGDSRCIMSLKGGNVKNLSFDHKPTIMGERLRIENSGGFVAGERVNEILALSRALGDFKFKVPYIDLKHNQNKYITRNTTKNDIEVKIPPELYTISAEPDLLVYDLEQLDYPEFMVLACDGIWDCYTNTELVNIIRNKLSLKWKLNAITEHILSECIGMASTVTGIGFDNMTLIIVAFHKGKTIDQWYESMISSVFLEKEKEFNYMDC